MLSSLPSFSITNLSLGLRGLPSFSWCPGVGSQSWWTAYCHRSYFCPAKQRNSTIKLDNTVSMVMLVYLYNSISVWNAIWLAEQIVLYIYKYFCYIKMTCTAVSICITFLCTQSFVVLGSLICLFFILIHRKLNHKPALIICLLSNLSHYSNCVN